VGFKNLFVLLVQIVTQRFTYVIKCFSEKTGS